jgi:thiol-disulfide isomerase/thioredoxin
VKTRRILVPLAVLVGIQVAAVVVYRLVERAQVGQAPFVAEALDGATAPVFAAEERGGRRRAVGGAASTARLVHFWASWCRPCRVELPGLLALVPALRADGIEVVAVAVEDDWPAIERFFGGEVPPSIVLARGVEARARYGVAALPATFLVGPDGRLLRRFAGTRVWSSDEARAHLRAALVERRPR